MPITIYGDGYITGLGNVSVSSNVAVGNIKIAETDFYGSLTANGWQRFPGGLIWQWGSIPNPSSTNVGNISFPIPFPNAVFSVTTQDITSGADTEGFDIQVGLTYGGATVNGFSYSKQPRGFYWMAIGK